MEATTTTTTVAAVVEAPKPDTLAKLTEALLTLFAPRIQEMVEKAVAESVETLVQQVFESNDFTAAVESIIDSVEFSVEANIRNARRYR